MRQDTERSFYQPLNVIFLCLHVDGKQRCFSHYPVRHVSCITCRNLFGPYTGWKLLQKRLAVCNTPPPRNTDFNRTIKCAVRPDIIGSERKTSTVFNLFGELPQCCLIWLHPKHDARSKRHVTIGTALPSCTNRSSRTVHRSLQHLRRIRYTTESVVVYTLEDGTIKRSVFGVVAWGVTAWP